MAKARPQKVAAKKQSVEERRRLAAEMRKNAMSLRQIAAELGISHETARLDIEHGLKRLREETMVDLAEYRAVQVARREEIISAHRETALDPTDPKSHASAGVIHQNEMAIAKLMGTDQPMQIENKTEVSGDPNAPSLVIELAEPPDIEAMKERLGLDEEEEDGTDDQPA